ncbi:jg18745, partial [Pararge aegeria aegeria]
VSALPTSWKEELHPKFFEQNDNLDTMWEVYATLAPLEIAMQPDLLELIIFWSNELMPPNYCPLNHMEPSTSSSRQWPFCYIYVGAIRILLNFGDENADSVDDTLMCIINNIRITPYPENPIC